MFVFFFRFLVADTQLYKRLCPSVRWSVGPSITLELKTRKTRIYDTAVVIVCVWVCECVAGVVGGGVGVRLGVGCPCPPVRNDIVTPRHLFKVACTRLYNLSCPLVGSSVTLCFFSVYRLFLHYFFQN